MNINSGGIGEKVSRGKGKCMNIEQSTEAQYRFGIPLDRLWYELTKIYNRNI